jgi:voltage-gated potassium channel
MPASSPAEASHPPAASNPREPAARSVRALDAALLSLIVLNVVAAIVGTVPGVEARFGRELAVFEAFSVLVFTVEYVVRLWVARDRLRYVVSPMAVIDLLAVLPFYLPFLGVDLRVARSFRLLRLFRLAKAARYVRAVRVFGGVVSSKREELVIAASVMVLLVICASSLMYYAEHEAQPQAFSSIPAAMWWSIATLTTVGYGDIYPVTPAGRLIGSVVAVLGIGFFALPTAILGAGFVEVVSQQKETPKCPHCGEPLS